MGTPRIHTRKIKFAEGKSSKQSKIRTGIMELKWLEFEIKQYPKDFESKLEQSDSKLQILTPNSLKLSNPKSTTQI